MNARAIEEQAALWLERSEQPEWSRDDQARLQLWLKEDPAHRVAYWRLAHGWRVVDRLAAIGSLPAPASALSPWREAGEAWWRSLAAAALLLAVGLGLFQARLLLTPPPVIRTASFETAVGGRKQVRLPDGSRIDLNTATAVRAELTEDRRAVWLDRGEVYFDVRRDATRPFIVYAGAQRVTVLGTRFVVRRDQDRITVAVSEGRVRIDDGRERKPTRALMIGDGDIVLAGEQATLVAIHSRERVESGLAWRAGMLTFSDVTLADAASEFNRYNAVKLTVDDPEVARIRIGGSFRTGNVEGFARLLERAYGLKVEQRGGVVRIAA